ncbi:hypothetical protein COV18_01850 [Candidatus Woesearchaeota archaeon CG10_big_fil_rev_8_21_14_0_10_37_12]|nr:MAG: hypothetical protein COV18_01850 [Candidatus Woesearchaeota archaeon CG10_big_fil_rev_8_21_14_0_10_37_12]
MKLTAKLIEELVSELAGQDVVPLVEALRNKSNVSELKLAEQLKREINTIRNMLYRLYEHNLVSFTRKKDKKKGWYIYYWTLNSNRVKDLIAEVKKQKIHRLQERLDREQQTQFYSCSEKCVRLDFEESHDHGFKCPECGTLLDVENNKHIVERLAKTISEMQKELDELQKEEVPVKRTKVIEKSVKKKTRPEKTAKGQKSAKNTKAKRKISSNKKSTKKKRK